MDVPNERGETQPRARAQRLNDFIDIDAVVRENDALTARDEAIEDHRAMINATLAVMSKLIEVRQPKTIDESTLMGLGARIFNSSAAALQLTRSGFYQTAFMLLRDLIETSNLLDYFLTYKSEIARWRTSSERQRLKAFSPKSIRDALNTRDQLVRDVRNEYYALLSESAVHATYRGLHLLRKDDKLIVGPFADRRLTEAVYLLLPLLVSFGAQLFMRHFDDIDDEGFLRAVLTYNAIFLAWQKKHVPQAVFRQS
jgi:hypothetical protein